MTLSVLIPTYRYDCSDLVIGLDKLANQQRVSHEILVCDDGSDDEKLRQTLLRLDDLSSVRLFLDNRNRGRAGVFNFLAEQAQGDILMIVDADAALTPEFSFIAYIEAAKQCPVVCGGLYHPPVNPCPQATLRYSYERKADLCRSAACRNESPYSHLSTFNLLVDRKVFLSVRFDSQCTEYGYEDTLFGAELQRRGIPISHIDNPLMHMGLEPNDVFLKKTETALRTLRRIEPKLQGHSDLLAFVSKLERYHLKWLAKSAYRLSKPLIKKNLLGSTPSLSLFSFYKLGYYLS